MMKTGERGKRGRRAAAAWLAAAGCLLLNGAGGGGARAQAGKCATPSFAPARNFDVGIAPVDVTAGDFNRDGRPDLAAAKLFSGEVSVLLNTCGAR